MRAGSDVTEGRAQDKADEAAFLMDQAIEKIWSLHSQNKLSWAGLEMMLKKFEAAKACIPAY